MNPLNEEVKSTFYLKPSVDKQSLEVVDSYEMTNDYKQSVCLPYFKEVHKVSPSCREPLIYRISSRVANVLTRGSTKSTS